MILSKKVKIKNKIINVDKLTKGSSAIIKVKCDYCGKEKNIKYKEYIRNIKSNNKFSCSYKCGSLKSKENNIKKYGVEHHFQLDEVKEKIKETMIEKYGVEHVSNIKSIKEQKKKRKLTEDEKNKISESHKNRNIDDVNISNNQRKETLIKKYGEDNISKIEEIKKKKEKTFNDKYDGFTFNSNQLNKKVIETCIEKYGVKNIMLLDEIKEKIKKTNLKKYGYEYASQNIEIKNKIKNTMLEKYGVDNIMFSENFRKTNLIIGKDENYIRYIGGRINEFKCDNGKNHIFEIDTDNYFKRKQRNCKICTICFPIDENVSIKEKELLNYIKEIYKGEIIENYRDSIEIDIFLPDLNIGFEFNGLYWHSDKFVHKNKHIDKLNFFKEKNIRIIYIWEDDWDFKKDIIKSQITNWLKSNNEKIYGRNCKIKQITDVSIVREFLNENHIQGFTHSTIKLGLYFNDELVSLMTFDKNEGRKKMNIDEWNLSRFCSKKYINVIGSADKLLKFFINNNNVKRIITYADKEWSIGDLYFKLGFKLINESKISYKYVINNKRINKQNFNKNKLKKIYKNTTGKTENQIMKENQINRVYDCGQMKFEMIF
jgi:hypothetical protein